LDNQNLKNSGKRNFTDFLLALALSAILVGGYKYLEIKSTEQVYSTQQSQLKKAPKFMYGFNLDSVYIEKNIIKESDLMGDILSYNGIAYTTIANLEQKAKDIFSVRKIRPGKKYQLIKSDECGDVLAVVYEPNPLQYVVYDMRDSVNVNLVDRHVEVCLDVASGVIETSLWEALADQDISFHIIDLMEEALSSSVDFYHIQKGDAFKLIYEKKYVENKSVGLGRVIGAYFKNESGEHYSYYYEKDQYKGYYDDLGRPNKGSFLRAPIKSSYRVSSGFNLRRFHPIKKRTIPHLGTDYAAPYGTPIIAVADGVVETASYTGNNGKYVKIKHDKMYKSQYLHMQRFAAGIRSGKRVKQGETIGYVGSTGLATGPHVCFRFWKNGKQINHRREIFPPAEPLPEFEIPNYIKAKDEIKSLLNVIPIQTVTLSDEDLDQT
jgi:murein DD-endopeptidase MepM/ murein hydrolase activator NlpD